MNFVHCMMCYKMPSESFKSFHLSSCRHIACSPCVEKGCFALNCKICQKTNPRVLAISSSMKPEYAEMFVPINKSIDNIIQEYNLIASFQSSQRESLLRRLSGSAANFDRLYNYCQAEAKKKEEAKAQMAMLIESKQNAEKTVLSLKAKLASVTRAQFNDTVNANLANMTHDPFRGSIPGEQRSFMTSTPVAYQKRQADHTIASEDRTMDASLSFSAATGFPKNSDSFGEVSQLATATSGVTLKSHNDSQIGGRVSPKKRLNDSCSDYQIEPRKTLQANSLSKVRNDSRFESPKPTLPAVKKTRLDMVSRTQPLPLK